jgi:hypothetical protein
MRRDHHRVPGRLLVTSRLLLLVAAGAAAVAAFVPDVPRAGAPAHYRCPMHPEVSAPAPGDCPICGMALVDEPVGTAAHADAERVDQLDPARIGRAERRVIAEPVRVPAWVDAGGAVIAMLYRDDLVGLAPDDPAVFYPAAAPGQGIDVRRAAAPATDWDGATVAARFDVASGAASAPPASASRAAPGAASSAAPGGASSAGVAAPGALAPGTEGWLAIAARPRELVVVPSGAILEGTGGPYVLAVADGGVTRRAVLAGRTHQGAIAVLAGLAAGDQVVVAGAFLLDPGPDPGPGSGPGRGPAPGRAP